MRKIILDEDRNTIHFDGVDQDKPIFAKKNGVFRGMVVKEDSGWILRLGGAKGADGYHDILRKCLENGTNYGYEFFT